MSLLNALYVLSSVVVIPFWLAMFFAPRGKTTERLLNSMAAFLILGGVYLFVLVGGLLGTIGQGGGMNFSSVEALAQSLSTPAFVLVLWIHVLVGDLAAGYWIYHDGLRNGIGLTALRGVLVLTLLLGPVGVLSYGVWRLSRSPARRAAAAEVTAGARGQ
ncbi:MAG: DUF4281 domain-containing protein [Anaerolineae bacterium]|nr:DUF4281 domain-containing protein [Anaerolineae bacterium]